MKTEIIPVIHMVNEDQVSLNIQVCRGLGVKKVFIINHAVSVDELIECATKMKIQYADMWIGINMLGIPTKDALSKTSNVDGIWCDATITSEIANSVRTFSGMFFGGLAFKYQKQPIDLELACVDAKLAYDVACTSGPGTGHAPSVDKIHNIRKFLGDHPMAIASGVSIYNIDSYKNIVNYLLVASSITNSDEIIISSKLEELLSKLKNK